MENGTVVNDAVLGALRYVAADKQFVGSISTDSGTLELLITPDGETVAATLVAARLVVERLPDVLPQVQQSLIATLLPLKNDVWLDDDEPQVTRGEFLARARFETLQIYGSGTSTFLFRDDGMFGGHVLLITVGSKGDIGEPRLFG